MASLRDRFQKSFLERSHRLIGAIAIVLIVVGTGFSLLLTGGVFAKTYKVTALFRDAAGIQPDDKITVAGLEAGRVKGVQIRGGIVAIELGVNRGVELTKDTHAEIVIQTLLGKRAVNLISGDFAGIPKDGAAQNQLLQDGDTIPLNSTTTPIDIVELNDISTNLATKSDPVALTAFLKELTQITAGKKQQVRQVATGLARVLKAVDARKDQLADLITSLRILFTTIGERKDRLIGFIDHFDTVFQNLAARQRSIATLLQATDSASHETANLVSRNRRVLDSDLNLLHQTLLVLGRHQLDLAATISYLEDAVQGYQSVGHTHGPNDPGGNRPCGLVDSFNCSLGSQNHWANIFVQSLGPAGVDALIGQCGLVDQFFDSVVPGADCNLAPPGLAGNNQLAAPSLPGIQGVGPLPQLLPPSFPILPGGAGLPSGGNGGTGGPGGPGGLNLPTPKLPVGAAASAPLPSQLGDLILSVLDGWSGK